MSLTIAQQTSSRFNLDSAYRTYTGLDNQTDRSTYAKRILDQVDNDPNAVRFGRMNNFMNDADKVTTYHVGAGNQDPKLSCLNAQSEFYLPTLADSYPRERGKQLKWLIGGLESITGDPTIATHLTDYWNTALKASKSGTGGSSSSKSRAWRKLTGKTVNEATGIDTSVPLRSMAICTKTSEVKVPDYFLNLVVNTSSDIDVLQAQSYISIMRQCREQQTETDLQVDGACSVLLSAMLNGYKTDLERKSFRAASGMNELENDFDTLNDPIKECTPEEAEDIVHSYIGKEKRSVWQG